MAAQGSNDANADSNVHDFSNANTWVVDTGTTHHLTSNLDVLSQFTHYNGDAKITIGNGKGLHVKNIGLSFIKTSRNSLILHNVLHVPRITMNILSVKKSCRDNG